MFEKYPLTAEFTTNADRLSALLKELQDSDQMSMGGERVRELLDEINLFSQLRGQDVKVNSCKNSVDWSYGEADPGCALEVIPGEFEGNFIGYQIIPDEDQETGEMIPVLAVVLDTTVMDHDIDAIQVFVVTPIPSAVIELKVS